MQRKVEGIKDWILKSQYPLYLRNYAIGRIFQVIVSPHKANIALKSLQIEVVESLSRASVNILTND